MSEELSSAAPEGLDPVATSLALTGASRAKADAFLDDQRHHLHEQLRQIHLDIMEKWLGVLLRVATLMVGLAAAGGIGLMVWDAAHSKGLIIEPFGVPPSLRERGLDGEVIASQLIDKLTAMTQRESSRAVQSYANNWGNNIKVEIPETGVSIGELRNFLREWLGHDIRISGEVYKTTDGVAVTARTSGGDPGATFTGKEADLDALLQQAAEHVYEATQPYRYANYLDRNYDPVGLSDRVARATAIYRRLIAGNDPKERAWAWNGLGTIAYNLDTNDRLAASYYHRAIAATPDFTIAYYALSWRNAALGQEEEQLQNQKQANRLLAADPVPDLNPQYAATARISSKAMEAALLGDYATAIPLFRQQADLPDDFSVLGRYTSIRDGIVAMALRHDLRAANAWLQGADFRLADSNGLVATARAETAVEARDWPRVLKIEGEIRNAMARGAEPARLQSLAGLLQRLRPDFTLAHAKLGDFAGAEAMIAPAPGDDDPNLRMRARLAEMEGKPARADWWFARAAAHAPDVPFTDEAWGRALLGRGQPDAAIAKFTLANQKGPHFADPLEGWGEALMAKNLSHLALAKFAEADKYAPNWGRLHLKWGEALFYAGKRDEAKAQFSRAAALDLSRAEKAELARHT